MSPDTSERKRARFSWPSVSTTSDLKSTLPFRCDQRAAGEHAVSDRRVLRFARRDRVARDGPANDAASGQVRALRPHGGHGSARRFVRGEAHQPHAGALGRRVHKSRRGIEQDLKTRAAVAAVVLHAARPIQNQHGARARRGHEVGGDRNIRTKPASGHSTRTVPVAVSPLSPPEQVSQTNNSRVAGAGTAGTFRVPTAMPKLMRVEPPCPRRTRYHAERGRLATCHSAR